MTDNNKPTVVDDFFSALFANDNNKFPKEMKPEETPAKPPPYQAQELDEFDEYSLLSSKRKLDDGGRHQVVVKKRLAAPEVPAHILSKKSIDWSDVSPESRMLIRQLPHRVDKEDVMDYFSTYGEVLEVVFKNAFGFVQFDNPSACANAVKCENGKQFKGVVLELEVCRTKPYFARDEDKHRQKKPNTKNQRRTEDYRRPQKRNEDAEYDPQQPQMNVTMVKIIAWNNVSKAFILHVENEFRKKNISVATVTLQYPNTRDSLLKKMVREGVKAVVTINRDLESRRKISLQVFSANTSGEGVRFDEYDSILGEQAAEIVLQSMPRSESTYQTSAPSVPNTNYTATTQPFNLDTNTLAALYNALQVKPSPVRQYPSPLPPTQYQTIQQPQAHQSQQQPTVSQLLATLMNGISPPQHAPNGPYPTYLPQPSQPINPSPSQPNIAQLLSTAMNGNPLLGQLVANQSSNNSNALNDNQLRNILANYQMLTNQSSNQARPAASSNPDPSIQSSSPYNLTTTARY